MKPDGASGLQSRKDINHTGTVSTSSTSTFRFVEAYWFCGVLPLPNTTLTTCSTLQIIIHTALLLLCVKLIFIVSARA